MGNITKRGKPTQDGNPHQLTTNQHVFPKASVGRFAGSDGMVECLVVASSRVNKLRPSNSIFCAHRAETEGAEHIP